MLLQVGDFGSALAATAWCVWMGQKSREIMKLLLAAGANVNAALSTGMYGSALVAVIEIMGFLDEKEDMEALKLLLDHGADVHLRLQHGRWDSAVAAAAAQKDHRILATLLRAPSPETVFLSESGARLYWTLSESLASSITVMGEDLDPDGPCESYSSLQMPETTRTLWHSISQEPMTQPSVPCLVVRADELDGGDDLWGRFPSDYKSEPLMPERFIVVQPSTAAFVTVHDFVSTVHPWLMEIRELLPRASPIYLDNLTPETRLVVSATDPLNLRVAEENEWLENRRHELQADQSSKALDKA